MNSNVDLNAIVQHEFEGTIEHCIEQIDYIYNEVLAEMLLIEEKIEIIISIIVSSKKRFNFAEIFSSPHLEPPVYLC